MSVQTSRFGIRRKFLILSVLVYLAAAVTTVLVVRDSMRRNAVRQAGDEARLLLDRNLAIHTYYTHQLKPPLLKALPPETNPFNPTWMSSTYAVREINKYFQKLNSMPYYYKECAIDARSPANEADEYEKRFLKRASTDENLTVQSEVRTIDGQAFLVTLRRGESMQADCLRCHDTPESAPKELVRIYGPKRSFGRSEGQLVSAISTRIPLAIAFAEADRITWRLSFLLLALLGTLLAGQYLMHERMLFGPLRTIGEKVSAIAEGGEHLGEQVDVPQGKELSDVATALNRMSTNLRTGRDNLEQRVESRTKALQESEARYRTLFDSLTEGFALHEIILDEQGAPCDYRFLDVNPAFQQLTGLKAESLIGQTVLDILPGTEQHWIDTYRQVAVTGEPTQFENYSGELKKHFRVLAFSPAPGRFATLFVDVTDQKQAEKDRLTLESQIQHTQKLESLGVLAGGIAHDFNNLLAAILGYADLALDELSPSSPCRDSVEEIKKASLRAAQLTTQMLAYSGKGRFILEPINLSELVEEMGHLLEVSKSKRTVLRFDLADNLPPVEGDASQLGQVVMNLITNAAEAIGDKSGTVALCTGAMEITPEYIADSGMEVDLPPGYYAYLEVSDTGCGMDKETQSRIFDPFFTTKFTGRGLGLSALQGIVRGHHGSIKVYSEPGKGTTIKILLPCMPEDAQARGSQAVDNATPEAWKASGTVLVADDEEAVRTVAKMMLSRIGFDVLTAADGQEAIEFYKQHRDEVSVVLLDMTMPRLSGEEAFRELRLIDPSVKVVLCSGYNEQEAINRFTGKGLAGFIQKPYHLQKLIDVIRQVVEGE